MNSATQRPFGPLAVVFFAPLSFFQKKVEGFLVSYFLSFSILNLSGKTSSFPLPLPLPEEFIEAEDNEARDKAP